LRNLLAGLYSKVRGNFRSAFI